MIRASIKAFLRKVTPAPCISRIINFFFDLAPGIRSEVCHAYFQVASLEKSLLTFKSLGWNPQFIVDVGAYHGEWTRTVMKIFPSCRFLMVEAQPGKEMGLKSVVNELGSQVSLRMGLLSHRAGDSVDFFELEQGSSIYEEHSHHQKQVRRLNTTTLDAVATEMGVRQCDLLKLDVQGHELEILKGGGNFLKATRLILLEVSYQQVNAAAPVFNEVIDHMAHLGFVVADICSLVRRPSDKVLIQSDILFIRKTDNLFRWNTLD